MSNSQCRTCSLPRSVRDRLESEWSDGKSYPYLSELSTELGYELPPRTLNNHFIAKHSQKSRSLSQSPDTPKISEGQASSTMTATGGEINTAPIEESTEGIKDFDTILREFGFDPAVYSVNEAGVRTSRWQSGGKWLVSYRIQVVLRDTVNDLDSFEFDSLRRQAFEDIVIRDRTPDARPASTRAITVVVPADRQVGKTGSRGGTEELLERCHAQRERLAEYLVRYNPESVIYGELGDIVEEFNSVASEKFTNDRSLMKQLEIAGSIIESDLQTIHAVVPTIQALTVPSNHAGWRSGKDYLGKPEDDWGIFLLRQVGKMFSYRPDFYSNVSFTYPGPWEVSTSADALGFKLGFTHGDHAKNQSRIPEWWRGQASGSSALRDISVLNTGHFHTPRMEVIGRDPNGMPTWWLQAPTVDAGSDWFRHMAGYDSDPGLMVYTIQENIGFDPRTLEIL